MVAVSCTNPTKHSVWSVLNNLCLQNILIKIFCLYTSQELTRSAIDKGLCRGQTKHELWLPVETRPSMLLEPPTICITYVQGVFPKTQLSIFESLFNCAISTLNLLFLINISFSLVSSTFSCLPLFLFVICFG